MSFFESLFGNNKTEGSRPEEFALRPKARPPSFVSYGPESNALRDFGLDRRIGTRSLMADLSGEPLQPFGEGEDRVTQEMIDAYKKRTAYTKEQNKTNFMNSGMSQSDYMQQQNNNTPDPTEGIINTDFNADNPFLRNRMGMMGQQPAAPPQMPIVPAPPPAAQPAPQMPSQLAGIMQLADRSNISPAMRYAAENYSRLGGAQRMNDSFERGRAMIQGESV